MVLASIITTLSKNLQSGYFLTKRTILFIIVLKNSKRILQFNKEDVFVDLTVKYDWVTSLL